ncbi:MAG TPA: UvrB/UvrC motif-containing protein [Tepidisphaeraceae bacterium]|nr:UvrB/UvrC motif-containing protein [Tepidisphaeraceae bacterium]
MDDRISRLNDKARGLPKAPGVYLMKDDKGRVIYVGKSASLRDRVCSYFQASTKLEPKKAGLLEHVVDFEVIQTESEVEALLAENRLIKDIQPRYNASLRDDKTFPYLMITVDEDFPGVYITREPRTEGVKLFGPFTSVYALKEAVTLLQKAFKFRTCHLDILEGDNNRRFFRPCLLYPIKQCTAPCAAKIHKDAYREDINRLIQFLEGDKKTLVAKMEKEMIQASKDLDFEKAARLRDEIKALQALGARARSGDEEYWQPESFVHNPREGMIELQAALGLAEPPRIIEGIDIAHLQGGELVGSKVCFIDGVPFKDGYRRYRIKHGQGNNDYLSIQEVVSRRYREAGQNNELYPDVILIDGGLGQLHAALEVFKSMDVKPPMVIALAKKEELVYVQAKSDPLRLSRNNTGLKLLQYIRDEAHRFAQHYHHILRRKAQLEEDVRQGRRPPRRKKGAKASAKPQAADVALAPSAAAPHTTLPGLTILNPAPEPQLPPDPLAALDSEDVAAEVPNPSGPATLDRDAAAARGVQPTHVLPPEGAT